MDDLKFTILQEFGMKKALGMENGLSVFPLRNRAEYVHRVAYWEQLIHQGAAERIEEGPGKVVYRVKYEAAIKIVKVGMNEADFQLYL